jgi:dienelactone hydrolase
MRFLEVVSCLLMLPSIFVMFLGARTAQREARVICILLIVVLVAHLIREGMHWQMWPAYLAAAMVIFYTVIGGRIPSIAIRWMGLGCFLLIILSSVFSYLLPMFQLPKPTGKYVVGTRILHMVDASRLDEHGVFPSSKRELMMQVWYPAEPENSRWAIFSGRAVYRRREETTFRSSYQAVLRTHSWLDAPLASDSVTYPVLLFNPAWMGQRTQSMFLMEELASHGFVVVSIDHTYDSGLVAFPNGVTTDSRFAPEIGNFEHATADEQRALGDKYVRIEAMDDIFVLDQLQAMNQDASSIWYRRLDMHRVGTLGHSIGGAAALQACFMDPRIYAALNMDGWTFGDVALQGLSKPHMLMYEGKDQIEATRPVPGSDTPAQQRYWQFDEQDRANIEADLHQHGGIRLYIEGASHWNFTDRALYSPLHRWTAAGPIIPQRAHSIASAYTVAFFSHALNGNAEPLLDTRPGPFGEVQIENREPAYSNPQALVVRK